MANQYVAAGNRLDQDELPAQTGLSNDVTAISILAAGQSTWGQNQLGETLHYAPGLGWKIVDDYYVAGLTVTSTPTPAGAVVSLADYVLPRAGSVVITATVSTSTPITSAQSGGILINGGFKAFDNSSSIAPAGTGVSSHEILKNNASVSYAARLPAGTIISMGAITVAAAGNAYGSMQITYNGS